MSQPDRLVVGGIGVSETQDFAVACYGDDGSPDTGFGNSGVVFTDFAGGDDQARAIAIQGDGKIVVAGGATVDGVLFFGLARYNTDGSLDTDFGVTGKTTIDFGGIFALATAVALQTDDKIVVAGQTINDDEPHFAISRLNTDGSLDTDFGTGGKVVTNLGTDDDQITCMLIQGDGKIVVAGSTHTEGSYEFAIARYNADGTLDTAGFGTAGFTATNFGTSDDKAYSIAIQDDGKLVVAGATFTGESNYAFAIARYNVDGTLDTSGFGTSGKVVTVFGPTDDRAFAVQIQSDGKIVAAGRTDTGGDDGLAFALARYANNGTLDSDFGTAGLVVTSFGGADNEANGIAIRDDGKILAVGKSTASGENFGLARYEADGTLDATFGTDGLVTDLAVPGTAYAVLLGEAPTPTPTRGELILHPGAQIISERSFILTSVRGRR